MKYVCCVIALMISVLGIGQSSISWQVFRDSALSSSYEIRQTEAGQMGAEYELKSSTSGYFPRIDLAGDASYSLVSPGTFLGSDLKRFNYSVGANLQQPIYAGGALRAQRRLSKERVTLERYTDESTREQILYNSDVIYWQCAAYKKLLSNAENYYKVVDTLFSIVNLRYDDGMVSKSDLLMVHTRLKEAELSLIQAERAAAIAMQQFNIAIRLTPEIQQTLSTPIDYELPLPPSQNVNEVLQQNTAYKLVESNLSIQQQLVAQSRSAFNPTVTAGIQGSWATAFFNVTGDPGWGASVYVAVRYPLLQWGKRFYKIKSAKSNVTQLQWQKMIVKDDVTLQLNNSWTKLNDNYRQIQTAYDNLNIALENMKLNTLRYNEGQLPIIDVLSSQLSWIQANNNYINALLAYKIAYAEYQYTIGNIDEQLEE